MSALNFRSAYGFPSHGIASIRVITRDMITPQDFAFIGDSVGSSIAAADTAELPALLDGVFASTVFDAVGGRCTAAANCIGTTGVQAAQAIPTGTEIAIVELGYNDPSSFAGKIDQVMTALRGKGVTRVGWVTMSERRASSAAVFAAANQALNAARARWPELVVLDWNQASSGSDRDRWFTDDVHLSTTGQSEFALWLRSQTLALATAGPGKLGAGRFLRVKIPGRRRRAVHRGLGRGAERHCCRPVGLGVLHGVAVRIADAARRVARQLPDSGRGRTELGARAGRRLGRGVCLDVRRFARAGRCQRLVHIWVSRPALLSASSTRAAARARRSVGCPPDRRSACTSRATVACRRRMCRQSLST